MKYIAVNTLIPINKDTPRLIQEHMQKLIRAYEKSQQDRDIKTARDLMQLAEGDQ